jgi:hypothetical protein
MFWPRLQLTKLESERWAIYSEPDKLQRPALYRAYAGELSISSSKPEDIENIQISRRARVFALTASGDVHNTEVQIYDSAGEQYTMGYIPMSNLLPGLNVDPRGLATFTQPDPSVPKKLALGQVFGIPINLAPHVFEPNIVLLPNQTLSFKARAAFPTGLLPNFSESDPSPQKEEKLHVSFALHVWEFSIE